MDEREDGVILRPGKAEAPLAVRQGILVFTGTATGTLDDAVRRQPRRAPYNSGGTVAETCAVLSTLPLSPRISGGLARHLVGENVLRTARLVTLSSRDYIAVPLISA
jgi:hypothetical protein